MRRCCLLLCLVAIAGAPGHAQSPSPASPLAACPWLTQGGAAKALGGEVSVAVHVSDSGEGWCGFSRAQKPDGLLKIEVSKTALASCGAGGAMLKGVGNEAMRCALSASGGKNGEMISGRVRDLYFVITLEAGRNESPANAAGKQDDTFEQIAEQVAGNLF